jgi:hypothetical protein
MKQNIANKIHSLKKLTSFMKTGSHRHGSNVCLASEIIYDNFTYDKIAADSALCCYFCAKFSEYANFLFISYTE